ncbi:MAG: hypothetical protein ACE148_12530 [Vicinamibacterales bacterium]
MALEISLARLLEKPEPDALWELRADLLALLDRAPASERPRAEWSLTVAGRFHEYLSNLAGTMTARDYSQWASQLDMGSVGLLALQDLVTDREQVLKKLFLGGMSEALMVLASRQYVKAWQAEARQVQADTLWWLFEALWKLSRELRPGLAPAERRADIDSLISAARSADSPPALQAATMVALFEAVLIASLGWASPLLARRE